MSWKMHHDQSQEHAQLAEAEIRNAESDHAVEYYRRAAELETLALAEIEPDKTRTSGITWVSAISLWFKAHEYQEAQRLAYRALADETLPIFAIRQIKDLLQIIWSEELRKDVGAEFAPGEVIVQTEE